MYFYFEFENSLYILETWVFILTVSLRGKVFKSNLFFLMDPAFDVIVRVLRTLCLTSGHEGILLYFILQSFMVLCFIFRSVIYLKLILYKIKFRLRLIFLIHAYKWPLVSTSFVDNYSFSIELLLHYCQRLDGHMYVALFLDCLFCSIDLCVSSPIYSLDYCRFIVSEI